MAIFDQNTFIALERDISDIGKANNEKVIVKPRIGASYKSLPLIAQEAEQKASQAIEKVIEHGMVRGFVTEALLKAWKPNFDGARAKADDTKKIWRWELTSAAGATQITGNWVDTGLSELDQAKLYTDSNPMFQALHLTVDMNLDDVLTDGHYSAKATEASVERNYPVAEAGHLEVGRIGAASRYQRYTTLSGKIFVRTKSTNWGDWKIQGMDLTHPKISSSVLPANTDLNNITTHGTYSFVTTNALIELNFPFKDNGTLVVERAGNASLTQIAYCMAGRTYVRFRSASWGSWIEIPTANRIMALVGESPKITSNLLPANTDLDNLTTHGVYSFSSANADPALNFPLKDSGTLIVDRLGNVSLSQLALCLTGRMFMRFKSTNWGAWVEIATVNNLIETIKLESNKQAKDRLSVPDLASITSSSYVVIPIDPMGNPLNPLISKNPSRSLPPASLTKTMTVLLAIESGVSLDTQVNILAEDIVTGSGFNFFKEDETVTLRDCLYGMMLPSANIAALAVARTIGGTVDNFVVQMNQRAQSLGMINTVFKNPTGLAATGQITTANDFALLTKAALDNPIMRSIWGQHSYSYVASGETRTITSSLVAVQNYELWVLGGKTGTLGSICNQMTAIRLPNNYTGLVVQMNAPDSESRANDVAALSLYSINKFCYPSPNQILETVY